MNKEETIYPSMVIRSQSEAIKYIEYIGMDATFDKVLIEILGGKE